MLSHAKHVLIPSIVEQKSKATVATIAEEATEEDGKKKRGPAKEKKVKDPNAPKRPASAYIEYQNAVRDDFRERHNELPYSDVLKKIGESWASMTDEQKQVSPLSENARIASSSFGFLTWFVIYV